MTRPTRSACARRRAFTLLEVITALLILVLMAALIIPRFAGQDARRADYFLRQVQDLLTVYAFRESTSTKQIALQLNPDNRTLYLLVLDTDPDMPDEPPDWRFDPFTMPVPVPDDMAIVGAYVDGESMGAEDWMIASVPGEVRTLIELDVRSPVGFTTVYLPSYATTAVRSDTELALAARTTFDLDASGRDTEEW
jgi:prepilin-type N-terminal cleavage/methylation domain-containing protein